MSEKVHGTESALLPKTAEFYGGFVPFHDSDIQELTIIGGKGRDLEIRIEWWFWEPRSIGESEVFCRTVVELTEVLRMNFATDGYSDIQAGEIAVIAGQVEVRLIESATGLPWVFVAKTLREVSCEPVAGAEQRRLSVSVEYG